MRRFAAILAFLLAAIPAMGWVGVGSPRVFAAWWSGGGAAASLLTTPKLVALWLADEGVNLSSTNVTSWESLVGSYTATQTNSALQPSMGAAAGVYFTGARRLLVDPPLVQTNYSCISVLYSAAGCNGNSLANYDSTGSPYTTSAASDNRFYFYIPTIGGDYTVPLPRAFTNIFFESATSASFGTNATWGLYGSFTNSFVKRYTQAGATNLTSIGGRANSSSDCRVMAVAWFHPALSVSEIADFVEKLKERLMLP